MTSPTALDCIVTAGRIAAEKSRSIKQMVWYRTKAHKKGKCPVCREETVTYNDVEMLGKRGDVPKRRLECRCGWVTSWYSDFKMLDDLWARRPK